MPIVPVKFERDERYAGGLSDENDQAWAELTPVRSSYKSHDSILTFLEAGDGFIVVNDPGKYNLPPGQDIESGGQMYDISMFHQLHCLFQIRNHYYLWQGSIGRNNSKEIQEQLLGPQEDHVHHCFDYIRQALMCAGDMTVEVSLPSELWFHNWHKVHLLIHVISGLVKKRMAADSLLMDGESRISVRAG